MDLCVNGSVDREWDLWNHLFSFSLCRINLLLYEQCICLLHMFSAYQTYCVGSSGLGSNGLLVQLVLGASR
jgi:hypothetical protein